MNIETTLLELCAENGPAGFEEKISARAARLLREYSGDVRTDRLGNVTAHFPCGRKDVKTVLLDAHVDELGLIVSAHEEGFLRFDTIGGIDPRMLPGQEVTVLTDPPIFGVVSCLPPHVLTAEQMEKALAVKDLYIDVGMNQEEALKDVPVGTVAVYRDKSQALQGDVLSGKAMDNRAGFTAVLAALEALKGKSLAVDLVIMAGAQEEVGMRGAGPAAFGIDPDYAIVVDLCHANTPDSKGQTNCVLGGGPSIAIGPNTDRKFTAFIRDTAKTAGMKYQLSVHTRNSGTNAFPIQTTRTGVVCAIVEVPSRYLHSPVECIKAEDIENTGKLIALCLEKMRGAE
ncbi:MAG: M20/M25/M40 family metallo-hydrolase [Treponema sp.]|jgi:endoglucanase|nr:M20/M25/M40 family metallo-hydrolase [Treponema sp.]